MIDDKVAVEHFDNLVVVVAAAAPLVVVVVGADKVETVDGIATVGRGNAIAQVDHYVPKNYPISLDEWVYSSAVNHRRAFLMIAECRSL
jgi:hypothetical protein